MNTITWTNTPSPTPLTGDMILKPGQDQMLVFDGSEWIICSEPYSEASEHYFRQKFEEESETVHEDHPDLKVLWEEYRILRRLKTGE